MPKISKSIYLAYKLVVGGLNKKFLPSHNTYD